MWKVFAAVELVGCSRRTAARYATVHTTLRPIHAYPTPSNCRSPAAATTLPAIMHTSDAATPAEMRWPYTARSYAVIPKTERFLKIVTTGTEQYRSALPDVHSIETKSTVTGSIERASRRSKGTGSHSRSAAPARSSATVATACVASTASGKSKSCRENTALFASESDTLLVA